MSPGKEVTANELNLFIATSLLCCQLLSQASGGKGNTGNYDLLDEPPGQICLELASPEAEEQSPGKI